MHEYNVAYRVPPKTRLLRFFYGNVFLQERNILAETGIEPFCLFLWLCFRKRGARQSVRLVVKRKRVVVNFKHIRVVNIRRIILSTGVFCSIPEPTVIALLTYKKRERESIRIYRSLKKKKKTMRKKNADSDYFVLFSSKLRNRDADVPGPIRTFGKHPGKRREVVGPPPSIVIFHGDELPRNIIIRERMSAAAVNTPIRTIMPSRRHVARQLPPSLLRRDGVVVVVVSDRVLFVYDDRASDGRRKTCSNCYHHYYDYRCDGKTRDDNIKRVVQKRPARYIIV